MIEMIFGFLAPFVPELIKLFRQKQDNQHELDILNLQIQKGNQEHVWKMEEINTNADIQEGQILLSAPPSSFGVQLLDAAKQTSMSSWALYPAFYLFVFLDFLSGLVRPGITYAAFGFYMVVKWAQLTSLTASVSMSAALLQVWTSDDRSIVLLVLSYWFGHRAAKAAFGGSAMTSSKA